MKTNRLTGLLAFIGVVIVLYKLSHVSSTFRQVQGYVEGSYVYITSPLSGLLEQLPIEKGQHVKAGDLIFGLDQNPEKLKVREMKRLYNQAKYILQDLQTPQRKEEQEASKSMVNQAEAQLMLARLRMERYEKLYEMKAGNLDEAEAALQHFREITALKKQREHEYSISKMGARKSIVLAQIQKAESIHAKLLYIIWELSQKTRFAPMDAIVFDTYYSEGEWVPPGKPVASLLNYKGNEVEFFVPVRLLKKFQLGQQISVTCSGCKHKEKAMISFISPEAEYTPPLVYSQSNYDKIVFKLRAKPLHPKLFKPGEPVVISGF